MARPEDAARGQSALVLDVKRGDRRFAEGGVTEEQLLLDPTIRLGPDGTYVAEPRAEGTA